MVETIKSQKSYNEKNLNEFIQDFRIEESDLYNDIDQNPIDPVEKIWPNKVKFPYKSNDHECTLILEKKWNKVFVKLEWIPTYMGNVMENEFKKEEKKQRLTWQNIDASSSSIFLEWLWKALNDIIWKWRVSAAEKAQEAYKLLWFTNN